MSEHANEPRPNQIKRRRLTTVTVKRPRCPACGGVKLRKYRSLADQGDGSALRCGSSRNWKPYAAQ